MGFLLGLFDGKAVMDGASEKDGVIEGRFVKLGSSELEGATEG